MFNLDNFIHLCCFPSFFPLSNLAASKFFKELNFWSLTGSTPIFFFPVLWVSALNGFDYACVSTSLSNLYRASIFQWWWPLVSPSKLFTSNYCISIRSHWNVCNIFLPIWVETCLICWCNKFLQKEIDNLFLLIKGLKVLPFCRFFCCGLSPCTSHTYEVLLRYQITGLKPNH